MRTKTDVNDRNERDGETLFSVMQAVAWITLGIGLLLSVFGLHDFSDKNMSLMAGIGFMVGSVFIFIIGTAIHLVHTERMK